ncbi:MAG TPA: hypothetical protein VGF67_27445 [Ktedonobacteraceae bacterium]|jgi:hypothetical protein
MNEQEMQFADPDWQPKEALSRAQENAVAGPPPVQSVRGTLPYDVNQDAATPSYGQGYRVSPESYTPSLSPVTQQVPGRRVSGARRRASWWLWLIVIIVVISLFSNMSHFNRGSMSGMVPALPRNQGPILESSQDYPYALKGISQLGITSSGAVTVQVGNTGKSGIIVRSDDEVQPDVSYVAREMQITVGDNGHVTVFVPPDVALDLHITADTIEVDGFAGQISAHTSSGSIALSKDNLSGRSTVTSDTGDIILNQDSLSGQVSVQTGGAGNIELDGILNNAGNYQFVTDSGNITLRLPADTAMHVSFAQDAGTYQNDFANPTGNGPLAAVAVITSNGNIRIFQN